MPSVTLPGGLWAEGVHYRDAVLHPLSGEDEVFLADEGEALLPVERTTALLARCLSRIGEVQPITEDDVRALSIGDRESLLLHLRRLTLGDRMESVMTCPACGEKLDINLRTSDLLLAPYEDIRPRYETTIEMEGERYQVVFRLPTGGDQEQAARFAQQDPHSAARLIFMNCVEEVTFAGEHLPLDDLPAGLAESISTLMAEKDPQAEIQLALTCAVCGHRFAAIFDTGAYFYEEIRGRVQNLYREVHLLAFHYHWSESDIMAMTPRKRRIYLDLLSDTLSARRRQ